MKKLYTLEVCQSLNSILEANGNINFINKKQLYELIKYIRKKFNISIDDTFNVLNFYRDYFEDLISFEEHKFNDTKVGGFLVKNTYPDKSYMVINTSKDIKCTVFDITHELMHFLIHPEDRKHYISSSFCDIDNFEWQANEGAAELLVPYKRFIPLFAKKIAQCKNRKDYTDLLNSMSQKFVVSTAVIEYRIIGLKYEINQFESGISIENLEILSKKSQEDNGIFIESYSDKFKKKNSMTEIIKSIDKNFYSKFSIT